MAKDLLILFIFSKTQLLVSLSFFLLLSLSLFISGLFFMISFLLGVLFILLSLIALGAKFSYFFKIFLSFMLLKYM